MKRVGDLFHRITDRRTLSLAAYRAAQGKRQRPEVRRFLGCLDEETNTIGRQLREGSYAFGGYREFAISDPKSRIIHAPIFRDRVVHHAIIAVTGPVFESGAIEHSYACRKGKGQHAALAQASRWTQRGEWYGKMDVSRFYDSIDHDWLRSRLARRFREKRLLALFDLLLASYVLRPGKGLPIGALTSQYLGNFVLDVIDHRVKSTRRARKYLRYMDDMVFWGKRSTLLFLRDVVVAALRAQGLTLKYGGEWNRCDRGVPLLGYVVYPNRRRLGRQGRRRLRRKWRSLERAAIRGEISELDLRRGRMEKVAVGTFDGGDS